VFKPSKYQQALFDEINEPTTQHVVVEAYAGSGKTTTILEALKLLPANKKIGFVAFNKHIADELATKAPEYVQVSTLHSLGLASIRSEFGKFKVDSSKSYKILKPMANKFPDDQRSKFISAGIKVLGLLKSNLQEPDQETIEELAEYYSIYLPSEVTKFVRSIARAYEIGASQTDNIDFDDMIFLPDYYGLMPNQFDYLFVDECLPKASRVMLEGGSRMRIDKIVDGKLPLKVLSYNTETGVQESKEVVGWSKTPAKNKRMMKISFAKKYTMNKGNGYFKPHTLFCTENHKVFTYNRGYIPAGELQNRDKVQFEGAFGNRNLFDSDGNIYSKKQQTPVSCEICGAEFERSNLLGSHMRIHSNKKTKNTMSIEGSKVLADMARKRNENPEMQEKIGKTISRKMKTGEISTKFGGYIGNGHLSKQQTDLMEELQKHDERWQTESVITTNEPKGSIYPHHYKVDLGFPEHKLAVEIHGRTHNSVEAKAKDKKKQDLLSKLGWLTLEFSNEEIDSNIEECVDKILKSLIGRSPEEFEIVSVEEIDFVEEFVYDIEIEDNHNFYAEGVLVHNCQDLNQAQLSLIMKAVKPTGRLIAVGDRHQSIYGFRGADARSIPNIIEHFQAKVLPLSITYRCPTKIVELAQQFVPKLEASPDADSGAIHDIDYVDFYDIVAGGDLTLCRYNAPLIKPCFELIKQGRKATIRGSDIGKSLVTLIKSFNAKDTDGLRQSLEVWLGNEIKQAKKKGRNPQGVEDRVECIFSLIEMSESTSVQVVIDNIRDIFSDHKSEIVLSSIHKSKGLEAESVFILEPQLMPCKHAEQPWEMVQENNIFYVAITRTKQNLYYVR